MQATKYTRLIFLIGAVLLVGTGCSDSTDPVAGGGGSNIPTVSFAADLQPVFATYCLGCHGAGGDGGLDLTVNVAWANLVGVETAGYAPRQRVVSVNPDQSVLYLKLDADPSVGNAMPLRRPLLPAATLEKFRVWILEGAIDN